LTKTLGPSVSSISAGGDHSCALLGNGSVACWGRGAEGQLGEGNTTNQIAPVFVSSFGSGRTAVAISAGWYHTCALLDNGSVSCWGTGWQGALGNGDPGQQNTPILTSSFGAGRTAVALSAGHGYTCAVLDNGSVACWGDNTYGQLGDGTTQGRFTPVLTDSLGAGRTAIDVTTKESHTCALLDNGSISCWGRGISGVLGNGSSVNQNTPTLVSSLGVGRTAVAVSAGAMHTCAILDNGEVSCWGYGNGGRLGNGVRPDKYTPTLTSTLGSGRTAVAISLGFDHTCAVLDDGSASCWGVGSDGQLGNGGTSDQFNPTPASSVASERSVVGLAAGKYRTCVVLDNQSVACTGKGTAGQIGNNDTSNQVNFTYTIPMVVPRSIALENGDSDGDGVADPLDAYPEDITRTVECPLAMYGRYTCTMAPLGKFVANDAAVYPTDASVGHYVDRVGQAMERPCPVGRYNPVTSAESMYACLDSDAGSYVGLIGQGEQSPCDFGTYQPGTRSAECLPAGLGHYVDLTGQTNHIACPAGTWQNQTQQSGCLDAEWGHYANETGQVNQTACLKGFYNPNNGSILASDCGPADRGHYVNETGRHNQTECAIGTLQNQTGQAECKNASLGHYVETTGQSTELPCSIGTYNPQRGANNSTWCLPSTRGHFVNETGQGAQTPCEAGSYNPVNGSTNPDACIEPDIGHYVPEQGQWNQTPCGRGTFQNQTGEVSCTNADLGHYVNATGQSVQMPCEAGTFQNSQGQWRCLPASSGHYVTTSAQANQTACEAGTYNPNTGSTQASDCIDAEPGYFVNMTGQESQTPCDAGTYNPDVGSNDSGACMNASKGHYVPSQGLTTETPCPVQTFNPSTGGNTSDACQWALRGTYVDQTGQFQGIPCPVGTYNPAPGAGSLDSCVEAEPGSYVDEVGQSSVILCRIGTYNPDTASTKEGDCQWADLNHYVATEGQSKQTKCPPGWSQSKRGQSLCVLGEVSEENVVITPEESFQLIFILLTACMLGMGYLIMRRRKMRKKGRNGGSKLPTSKMQRRYKY